MLEKEQILNRWEEYIGDLFDDTHGEKPFIHKNTEGPPILECEIRAALKKAKLRKSPGSDAIHSEMLKILDDYGIKKITEIANEIYNSGDFPTELTKSIFIALPKKPGAVECELHRTISLMSHVTKLILLVLLQRIRRSVTPEILYVHCGFVKDKGTRNATFILRQLVERSIEHQQDMHLCFLDYSKAFDRVCHEPLLEMLKSLMRLL